MPVDNTETLAETVASRWGAAAVRSGQNVLTLEPADTAMVGDMLRWADCERVTVVPSGGGTKLGWGAPAHPPPDGVVLSTRRLTTGVDHCAGDLTAVLPAGATLA